MLDIDDCLFDYILSRVKPSYYRECILLMLLQRLQLLLTLSSGLDLISFELEIVRTFVFIPFFVTDIFVC
jgi:hypothetical protein